MSWRWHLELWNIWKLEKLVQEKEKTLKCPLALSFLAWNSVINAFLRMSSLNERRSNLNFCFVSFLCWSVYFVLNQFTNAITFWGHLDFWVTVIVCCPLEGSDVCHNMKGIHLTETQENQINKVPVSDWLQGLGREVSSHSVSSKKYLHQVELKIAILSSHSVGLGRGLFYFKTLLRYNPHGMTTNLKVSSAMYLSIFIGLCNYHHHLILEHFHLS